MTTPNESSIAMEARKQLQRIEEQGGTPLVPSYLNQEKCIYPLPTFVTYAEPRTEEQMAYQLRQYVQGTLNQRFVGPHQLDGRSV